MHHFATHSLPRIFATSRLPLTLSVFFVPATPFGAHSHVRTGNRQVLNFTAYAVNAASTQQQNHIGFDQNEDSLSHFHDIEKVLPKNVHIDSFVRHLDSYLPPGLRSEPETDQHAQSGPTNYRSVDDIHLLLSQVRKSPAQDRDLLHHVGVSQGRWKAALWLIHAILERYAKEVSARRELEATAPSNLLYSMPYQALDEVTMSPILPQILPQSSEPFLRGLEAPTGAASFSSINQAIGQVWQSLGSMIIEAANHPAGSVASKSIMIHVRHILALFHEFDVLPPSIYSYAPANEPLLLQRPPTLNIMSERIMAAISDAARKNNYDFSNEQPTSTALNDEEDEDDDSDAGDDIPADFMEDVHPSLGPHVWLEFVLWSCIEGGWVNEAAETVHHALAYNRDSTLQWSVRDWYTRDKQDGLRRDWLDPRSLETSGISPGRAHLNELKMLQMAPNTISSEVVCTLIDALLSTTSTDTTVYGNNATYVRNMISSCKRILESRHHGMENTSWNAVVIRMTEALSSDYQFNSAVLEQLLEAWSKEPKDDIRVTNSSHGPSIPTEQHIKDSSHAPLGLWHMTLDDFARRGDVQGAVRVFHKLRTIASGTQTSLETVATKSASSLDPIPKGLLANGNIQQTESHFMKDIPLDTMATILDLLVETKRFDLAKQMLFGENNTKALPAQVCSYQCIQPALIRFAMATADKDLLERVTRELEVPIPGATLHALLHCQIRNRNWDRVEEILNFLRDGEDMGWDATDFVAIAQAILRLGQEERTMPKIDSRLSERPCQIFQTLLQGAYNSPPTPSEQRDENQTRMIQQLGRILESVPTGEFDALVSQARSHEIETTYMSCKVPTKAFNMLLESVVDVYGSPAGKELWETWCSEKRSLLTWHGRVSEPVVDPNIQTIYSIMKPFSQAILNNQLEASKKAAPKRGRTIDNEEVRAEPIDAAEIKKHRRNPHEDFKLAQWGMTKCRELGVRHKSIKQDIRGVLIASRGSDDASQGKAMDVPLHNSNNESL